MEFSQKALRRVRERRLLIDRADLWLYEEIEPYLGQKVLEIGCGLGNFARHFTDRELYVGTDISEESLAHAGEVYNSHKNMLFHWADVTDVSFRELRRFNVDTIFSLNVFEHLEDDTKALRNIRGVLRRGGVLIVVVPAHDWLYGTMDRAIGHYRRYTKDKMDQILLSQKNLTCLNQKYINILGALGWFVNGRILRHEVPPSGQLTFFNRLVPLLKKMESMFTIPFGISLLFVAKYDSKI